MPTISDPGAKEAQPQVVTPPPKEPELFAAEIEMERKSSNWAPILVIGAIAVALCWAVYHFYKEATDKLSQQNATVAITNILKAQGMKTVRFTTGKITPSVNDNPQDPHYKLLQELGYVTTKPLDKDKYSIEATLTPSGQQTFATMAGVKKTTNTDGTVVYIVPLAQRKLVSIDKIEMVRPEIAQVTYSWVWDPNQLGKQFDGSSPMIKDKFTTWERSRLIDRYGVTLYNAGPNQTTIKLRPGDKGVWVQFIE
jgi:hypothetical protein